MQRRPEAVVNILEATAKFQRAQKWSRRAGHHRNIYFFDTSSTWINQRCTGNITGSKDGGNSRTQDDLKAAAHFANSKIVRSLNVQKDLG